MFLVTDYRNQHPAFNVGKIDPRAAAPILLFVFQSERWFEPIHANEGNMDALAIAVTVALLDDAFAKHMELAQARDPLPIGENAAPLDLRGVPQFHLLTGLLRHPGFRR